MFLVSHMVIDSIVDTILHSSNKIIIEHSIPFNEIIFTLEHIHFYYAISRFCDIIIFDDSFVQWIKIYY